MKLTIVLTVYNKEEFLAGALDSLLSQEVEQGDIYEVLAVNDGSSDRSASILDDYARRDKRIRILNQNNQGLSLARNNGLDAARGDYVWFVDADDSVSPHAVDLLCKAMTNQPDVIPIYAKTAGIDRVRNLIDPKAETGKDVLIDGKWSHCGVFWIMKKIFLLENNLRFFPGIYHEDAEFTPRMLYLAQSVTVVPKVLYTVNRDPNSITQIPRPKRAFDCLTVAEHICAFTEKMGVRGTEIGNSLDYNTAVTINNGLSIIVENSKEEQKHFNKVFKEKKRLLAALESAPLCKFRLEAALFKIFPGLYVEIYKLLKLFK